MGAGERKACSSAHSCMWESKTHTLADIGFATLLDLFGTVKAFPAVLDVRSMLSPQSASTAKAHWTWST